MKNLDTLDENPRLIYSNQAQFVIGSRAQSIFCFGSIHTSDPKHKQFPLLENFWNDFLKTTQEQKKIVFIEGGIRPVAHNAKEAIENGGEADFAVWLAHKNGVHFDSPEPSSDTERTGLQEHFSREDVELYYFIQYVYQWNWFTKKPDFKDYITTFLHQEKKESGWNDFDFSLENMENLFEQKLGIPFNHKNKKLFYSLINPHYQETVFNHISKKSEEIRNEYIIKNILDQWAQGMSIFIVYGDGHILSIQEALVHEIIKK